MSSPVQGPDFSLGGNLIFMISQPRAGSTLLQRMLGSHPDIHTVSEPWLMLHPLYTLTDTNGYKAEYDSDLARRGTKEFLTSLPSGEKEYVQAARQMYGTMYEMALQRARKRYFLDKTPRYYLIIRELYRTFPEAHFIFVLRNPLAVLCSVANTWVRGKWRRLRRYRTDVLKAPLLILNGIETVGERSLTVTYENVVAQPEEELKKICARLGVDFVPGIVRYGDAGLSAWPLGDQKKVYQRTSPDPDIPNQWVHALRDPQTWRLAHEYLEFLGKETLNKMGYDHEGLLATLRDYRPHLARLWFTFSLHRLLKTEEPSLTCENS